MDEYILINVQTSSIHWQAKVTPGTDEKFVNKNFYLEQVLLIMCRRAYFINEVNSGLEVEYFVVIS